MPFTTEAFVLEQVNSDFKLETVELDDPQDEEVLVEVVACGLCHTDLLIANGAFPSPFPNIVGHEGSGKVIKVGKSVTRVKEGDSVLLSFSYDQKCKTCKAGHPAACKTWTELNFGRIRPDGSNTSATLNGKRIHGTFFGQSTFGKHALVVESSVTKVPDDTDLVLMSPLGCGMQTGSGAVLNVLKPENPSESSIVVFGAGAVGMAAVFGAAYAKIKTIIVVDIVENRLELAKTLGATHSINGKSSDVVKQIQDLTDGGCDYVVEATGAAPCIKAGWEALGPFGKMVQLGTPGPGPTNNIPIHEAVCLTKTYYGVSEGDSNPPEYIPKLVHMYKEGKFPLDKISKVYSYKDMEEAIHAMHDGTVIKPIIQFK
ncbi:GroES-like protein [Cystobasidium minutum MCA 4210]|uniref:GroES-like protein n=1 Tax=Cystobasidium minutum MCA 4210 TaxID=1397322 RepID=UPI0034CFF594|eukprot:jgi/Rhomi1/96557/CE96556_1933